MTTPNAAGRPDPSGRPTTFDVRIWTVKKITNKTRAATHQVRWKVGPKSHSRNYSTAGLAASRRSVLLAAAKSGEAFDVETGLPVSEFRAAASEPEPAAGRTWLEHARDFADAKWDEGLAPGTRRTLADNLATVTPALFLGEPPSDITDLVREALYGWVFQTGSRRMAAGGGKWAENPPPAALEKTLAWLASHTRPVTDLTDPDLIRSCLNVLSRRLDGKPAAPNTVLRRRIAFGACLSYAVERGDLASNPLPALPRSGPKTRAQVDRRVCVNHRQARRLLDDGVRPVAPDLVAWYGSMYYAAMRPGEVQELREVDLRLPKQAGKWGVAMLAGNNPEIAGRWADDGVRAARQLKHRPAGDTREVPLHPLLVQLYVSHLEEFGTAEDGRLFRGVKGGPITNDRHRRVWGAARRRALTPAEFPSPLARRPYDLRHAGLSEWLNAGVAPTQIAQWAGHSVAVLLHTYARCIVGQDEAARRRIEAALLLDDEPTGTP